MQSTVFDLGFVRRLKDIDTLVVHYSIYVYIECHTGQYKKYNLTPILVSLKASNMFEWTYSTYKLIYIIASKSIVWFNKKTI